VIGEVAADVAKLRPDGACGSSPAGASAAQKRIATTSPALSERVGMRVEGVVQREGGMP
jgi:hypothetical protein